MSFQSGQVKQVIRTYAVEIQTGDKRDLDADTVTLKLRKAMGANCKSHSFVESFCRYEKCHVSDDCMLPSIDTLRSNQESAPTNLTWADFYFFR